MKLPLNKIMYFWELHFIYSIESKLIIQLYICFCLCNFLFNSSVDVDSSREGHNEFRLFPACLRINPLKRKLKRTCLSMFILSLCEMYSYSDDVVCYSFGDAAKIFGYRIYTYVIQKMQPMKNVLHYWSIH